MSRLFLFYVLSFVFQVLGVGAVSAAEVPETVILAENRFARLTLADYDAELMELPENMRFDFATSPKRISTLLNNLLLRKTLAAAARLSGIEPAPSEEQQTPAETEQALAERYIRRIEDDAGADFDAKIDQFTARARELYLVDRKKYSQPTFDEAKAEIVNEIRAKYIHDARDARLNVLRNDPTTKANQAAIDALVARPPAGAPPK